MLITFTSSADDEFLLSKKNHQEVHLVSIIVPCRNECFYIEAFINNALAQQLSQCELELIIVDGESDDGTLQILQKTAEMDPRIRLLNNPAHIVSSALNRAISAANGQVIVRMDVHTRYEDDYVLQCIRALQETNAVCVGGPWIAVGESPVQRSIAAAFQSRIGSGGAHSRNSEFSGWVDTVYLGAWWRSHLVQLGGFDENLVRNQDDELSLRINRMGGGVWQSACIRSIYFPRASFSALYRQFKQYGYWKIPVIRKHKLPASVRHVAPFAFLTCLALLLLFSLFSTLAIWFFMCLIFVYFGALFLGTRAERASLNADDPKLLTVVAVAIMHLGYAFGFGQAIWDFLIVGRGNTKTMSQLTR